MTRRVGIIGFGHIGRYLFDIIQKEANFEVAFVWNRSPEKIEGVEQSLILHNLTEACQRKPDLIIEVAHPEISRKYGPALVECADYLIGSPTALADNETYSRLEAASVAAGHGIYVPSGAFWGGEDIRRMADLGTLSALKITMKKHPSCFKLSRPMAEIGLVADNGIISFEGSVRELCPIAPNNVNTMAAGAIAAHNLSFDGVRGCIVADPALTDYHIVEVEVTGQSGFVVKTVRTNPAKLGVVTGQATYASFWNSVKFAHGKGAGVHLC